MSNELMYKFPKKIIVVGRDKDDRIMMSLRSPSKKGVKLPKVLEKALMGVDGYGGGHEYAVGANINKEDYDKFMKVIREEVLG